MEQSSLKYESSIETVWPRIKDQVAEMAGRHGELPEVVYAACLARKAFVFTVPEGFLVLKQGAGYLFIWMAAAYGSRHSVSLTKKYLPELEELAKECGLSKLRFLTTRKGWARLLRLADAKQPSGWKIVDGLWEKTL